MRGTIIRVQVERVPARTRPPKVLWLWWAGPDELDLDLAWRAYVRRFDLEHTVRFCKQALGGRPHGRPSPPRPTAGPGWCWLATPSCAWLARWPLTADCRGSGPDPSRACRPIGCAAGFRGCCARSAHRRRAGTLRVLLGPTQGPGLGACGPPPGLQEAGQEAHQQASQDRKGHLTDHSPSFTTANSADGQPHIP